MSGTDSSVWSIAVVIPARNEERRIGRCIRSVLSAYAHCLNPARLWIVVVADACSDSTASAARAMLRGYGEVIECASRSPGSARRLGAEAAIAHFADVRPQQVWLANTDADSQVTPDWLRLQLAHADDGANGVAGIVELDPSDEIHPAAMAVFRRSYVVSGDGSHSHVHGANLGVRADAYLDVGGWSKVTVAEDHCLWNRLRQRGWRLRSVAASVVLTSARLHGRAIGGFADTLRHQVTGAGQVPATDG